MNPLKQLRLKRGLRPEEYAQEIARVHAELNPGRGRMAAGRAKVYRWERGEAAPEWAAQRAIAHLEGVNARYLEQYGWPDWLHLAAEGVPASNAAWADRGALPDLIRTTLISRQPRRHPSVTGQALRDVLGAVDKALREQPTASRQHEVDDIDHHRIKGIEERTRSGKRPSLALTPTVQLKGAQDDYTVSLELLARYGYGPGSPLGMRLLQLVARSAHLCGWLSYCVGEDGTAQNYAFAALRASAAQGLPDTVAFYLANMAAVHLSMHGEAKDAQAVVAAARSLSRHGSERLAGLLDICEGLAYARRGQPRDSDRAFDRAVARCHSALTDTDQAISPDLDHLGGDWLPHAQAASRLHLKQPSSAMAMFSPLHRDFHQLTTSAGLRPETARIGLTVVHTHIECENLDTATAAGHQLFTLIPTPPPALADMYLRLFANSAYRTEPAVQALIDRLEDPRAHS
ncbi:hypothetical protein OG478_12640 [Streptomyces phaeochromogenes]|uniref:hypothetical protein n=1 Tax=Streptomyces phaeochromogenes TaxID=1923 RepID=UPI003868591F|nr:hypothetical protein OG478_12640 [Streptomyces phaeochromogenes]